MHGGKRRGLDYTPLFKFLLSKVGEDWDQVFSEASARLDGTDPVFWLVALQEHDKRASVRVGESSYYSGLFVDDHNRLRVVDPALDVSKMFPSCPCCTHTLNGVRFSREYEG